ncbi:MAG: RHS repeat-associated core domain-containing protein [Negativicutes bacterium]|nr:RHS repeat-associated core domain-containing protein [Negativicutes bacterium]
MDCEDDQVLSYGVNDGWNPIAILNPQSSILEAFTWGSDLSGSQQGAGGVGGLLTVSYRGTATTNCFVAYDGNGNVASLINAANGALVASYEYGPFGEVIRATGPMAKANPFRFSTKYQDDESDLLYYGYRYYKVSTGTWGNRDPIGESGQLNIYSFIFNNPVGMVDVMGFFPYDLTPPTVVASGGQIVGPPLKTNTAKGNVIKGVVVGQKQYPRKGECGCWRRNIYADFTPILTQQDYRYEAWVEYSDKFTDYNELITSTHDGLELAEEEDAGAGEMALIVLAAQLIALIEAQIEAGDSTETWTVTTTTDFWTAPTITWNKSANYYKNGESVKISNKTCKAKVTLYDINSITKFLTPVFTGITIHL